MAAIFGPQGHLSWVAHSEASATRQASDGAINHSSVNPAGMVFAAKSAILPRQVTVGTYMTAHFGRKLTIVRLALISEPSYNVHRGHTRKTFHTVTHVENSNYCPKNSIVFGGRNFKMAIGFLNCDELVLRVTS